MATGVLLDIDGVLTVSWKLLPGATETVTWLRDEQIEFRLVTNTSSKTRRQIAKALSDVGLAIAPSQILTAVSSASRYLRQHHPGARCLVLNEGALEEDLEGIEVADPETAEVVLLGGAGPSLGYEEFDAAFKLADKGVPVVGLHRNARYQTSNGPALDMGAFIVGLEAAAGIEIPVVGKPAPEFFHTALAKLDMVPAEALMVGDDIRADVLGGQAVGMTGVLVKTGKFRPSDLELNDPGPDHVIGGIGDLPDLVKQLR